MNKKSYKYPIVLDNYTYLPGESGFIGPFKGDGYKIALEKRRGAHRIGGRKNRGEKAVQFYVAAFADGHCQLKTFNA